MVNKLIGELGGFQERIKGKGLLPESFGIADGLGAFGQSVAVAWQGRPERPQMVCDRRDRADEPRPGLAGQGRSDRGKADSGNEQKAKGQGTGSHSCLMTLLVKLRGRLAAADEERGDADGQQPQCRGLGNRGNNNFAITHRIVWTGDAGNLGEKH